MTLFGINMEKKWINRRIDLALFTTSIGNFFKENDFEAIKGDISTGHQILAEGSSRFRLDGYVSVIIEGKPNDFSVKLELCKEGKRSSFTPILLTTMFLGGYFLTRKLKSEEDWMKLERAFWRHVDNVLLNLNNSAQDSFCSSEQKVDPEAYQ